MSKFVNQSKWVRKDGVYPKDAVMVSKAINGVVSFCKLGGGFVYEVSEDVMTRSFREATRKELTEPTYIECNFSFDDGCDESPIYKGYTDGKRWNGWAMPYFEEEVAKSVVANSANIGDDFRHIPEHDMFIMKFLMQDEEETFEATEILINGEVKKVYAIGAGSWTWSIDESVS